MTDETSADDRRDDGPSATGDGRRDGSAAGPGDEQAAADWHPNEPVPPELRDDATDGIDDELRETVADDLADLEDDDPDYPSSDDPIEPQRVDAENAAFVVLGVAAVLALVAVLLLSV